MGAIADQVHVTSKTTGAGSNTISSTTEEIMAANEKTRNFMHFCNTDGSIVISLGFGEAAVNGKGIVLQAGECWEQQAPHIWSGTVNAIAVSGTPVISFVEW